MSGLGAGAAVLAKKCGIRFSRNCRADSTVVCTLAPSCCHRHKSPYLSPAHVFPWREHVLLQELTVSVCIQPLIGLEEDEVRLLPAEGNDGKRPDVGKVTLFVVKLCIILSIYRGTGELFDAISPNFSLGGHLVRESFLEQDLGPFQSLLFVA